MAGFTSSGSGLHRSYSILKVNIRTSSVILTIRQPASSAEQLLINLNPQTLLLSGSFKRLQMIDKQSMKFQGGEDFSWVQPPKRGQLQMITQEIYDYLASSANSSENEFAQISGIVMDKGILIQILNDGMILFHDLQSKSLLRVLSSHWDSVNDIVIKEYSSGEENTVQYITCSKDNTLRLWST